MTNDLVPFEGGIQISRRFSYFNMKNCEKRIVLFAHQSVLELYDTFMPANLDCVCSVSGRPVGRSQWANTFISPSDSVLFTPTLGIFGGGGGGSDAIIGALLIVAAIAVWFAAPAILGMVAGMGVTGLGGSLAAVSLVHGIAFGIGAIGGAMLLGAAFTPAMPEISMPGTQASITSWSPQTTQEQGGTIPKYYGKLKVYGNIIATHIRNASDKQYLYVLICIGTGPYKSISDIVINDIKAVNLKDAIISTRLGKLDQSVLPGFNDTDKATGVSFALLYNAPVTYVTTTADFDKLTINLLFNYGLGYVADGGGTTKHKVKIQVKVKKQGDANWTFVGVDHYTTTSLVATPGWCKVADVYTCLQPVYDEFGFYIDCMRATYIPTIVGQFDDELIDAHYEGEATTYTTDYGEQPARWELRPVYRKVINDYDYRTIEAETRNRVPVDLEFIVPKGGKGYYDISIMRMTEDTTDIRYLDDVYFVGIMETLFDDYTYPRQALIGVSLLTNNQLSGSFKFSCITEASYVRVYDSVTQTWSIAWSDNPAWICYDVLTSPVFNDTLTSVLRYDGLASNRINLDDFVTWAAFCDEALPQANPQSVITGSDNNYYACIKDHVSADVSHPVCGTGSDNLVPKMTSATAPSGVVTASNYDTGHEPYRAFDNVFNSCWEIASCAHEEWIAYEFATAQNITSFLSNCWTAGGSTTDSKVYFEYYSAGTWITLYEETFFSANGKFRYFDNPVSATKYRIRLVDLTHFSMEYIWLKKSASNWNEYWALTTTPTTTLWQNGVRYYKGAEKRYTFNGGFDTRSSRWQNAMQIASVSQAMLMTVGTEVRVVVDKYRVPQQLICEGNLMNFREKFLDLTNRATEIHASFKNIELDYAEDSVSVFKSNTSDTVGQIEVRTSGVVKKSEVWRLAKYALMQNYRRRVIEGDLDIDAINFMVGDAVYVQSEIPEWNTRGGIVLQSTSSTVLLDRPVTFEAGVTYSIFIRISSTNEILIKTLDSSAAGETETVSLPSGQTWGAVLPFFGDIFAFGVVNQVAKEMLISNIQPTANHGATITAVEYDSSLYAQIDAMTPEIDITEPQSQISQVVIDEVVLTEEASFDEYGNVVRKLYATWVPSQTGTPYGSANVEYYLSPLASS